MAEAAASQHGPLDSRKTLEDALELEKYYKRSLRQSR